MDLLDTFLISLRDRLLFDNYLSAETLKEAILSELNEYIRARQVQIADEAYDAELVKELAKDGAS